MGKSINSWELKGADVVVRPALAGMDSGDTGKQRTIQAGRAAMTAALRRLRAAMEAKSGLPRMKKAPVLRLGRASLRSLAPGAS